MMRLRTQLGFLLFAGAAAAVSGSNVDLWLDEFSSHLGVSSTDGNLRARLSGTFDLEYFNFDRPPPGLIDTANSSLLNPRATLFVDAQGGSAWYAFAQVRIDRGFDPGDRHLRARLDELALRYTPWQDGRLNLQAGKFATVAGQWVRRHASWQNPLISAPLFYEQVTRITDLFTSYGSFPVLRPESTRFYAYNPVIWGPSYAYGASLSGRWSHFEWAVEAKNAALTSRPTFWGIEGIGHGEPTMTGRVAWRPNLQWTFGLSASEGPYLGSDAAASLEPELNGDAFRQRVILGDVSFEWRHWQVWAEWLYGEFDVPHRGGVHTHAYFVEAKHKFTPRFSGALRWNQQFFSTANPPGDGLEWGEDQWRVDLAGTWRLNAHSQIQVEIDWRHGESQLRDVGLNYAARFTLRF